ncbi:uncharacterized protein LOC113361664 [Papaver somniferum]|uniref:uncharacterized protein LOC113361664 n=1 Tax=Papaver somniferum TaxID=3469 RepID=UPI000E6FEDD3|nr:uncharacterized protein LOC113361664 [Papaver somniferum]
MNAYNKQVALRDLIFAHKCWACGIQETKLTSLSRWFVWQLWFNDDFEFEFIPSQGNAGNSGGLLSIWDCSSLELLDKRMGVNYISVLLRFRDTGFKFILTNAYSPCDYNEREEFWRDMAEIRLWSNEAWCLFGDLNAVRSDAERNRDGGDVRNMGFLNDFIMEQELVDLPLNGGAFMWSNKHKDPLLCRLDRFMVCTTFDAKFSSATQTALVRTVSDHNALLFELFPTSRNTFGNVGKEEDELTEKINVLNLAEETARLHSTQLEERVELLVKLNNVKLTRARMAFQRAKVNGFKEGDRNTKFSHKMANAKRRRNCITKLEVAGRDVFNQEMIKDELQQYYTNLFTATSSISPSFDNMSFKRIEAGKQTWLERPFDETEVWEAIKKCGVNKAPGPDGYNVEFYKACWDFIKTEIMAAINEFHGKEKLD